MKDLDKDKNRKNITRAEFFKIILLFPIKIILTILKKVFTIPYDELQSQLTVFNSEGLDGFSVFEGVKKRALN